MKEPRPVADAVSDLHTTGGIDRVRNVNFQIAKPARSRRVVLQLRPAVVDDADDVDEQFIVSSVWSRIFDRDRPVNPMKLALKLKCDALVDQGAAVGVDRDRVLKIGNAPGFCRRDTGES